MQQALNFMDSLTSIEGFLEFLGDAVLIANDSSEIIYANQPCLDLFKYTHSEFSKLTIEHLMNKQSRHNHQDKVCTYINAESAPKVMMSRGVLPCIDSKGIEFFARISIASIKIDGQRYGIATIHDYSTIQNTIDGLENEANEDKLTGLYNKRYLDKIIDDNNLPMWLSNAVGVLYFDLNKFKVINDTYGHDVGDHVLVEVSRRLKDSLRSSDLIFRVGGDEFIVLFSISENKNHRYELENIANKISNATSEPIFISHIGKTVTVGVSIGIGVYPYDSNDMHTLITLADQFMYNAKQSDDIYSFVEI